MCFILGLLYMQLGHAPCFLVTLEGLKVGQTIAASTRLS